MESDEPGLLTAASGQWLCFWMFFSNPFVGGVLVHDTFTFGRIANSTPCWANACPQTELDCYRFFF